MATVIVIVQGNQNEGYSWDCPHCDELNIVDADEMAQIRERENVVTCERCNHEFLFC